MHEQGITTGACKKCGRVGVVDEMFHDEDGVVCPDCKSEGAAPLGEWLRAHTQHMTAKEASEMAWKGELKPYDMGQLHVDAIVKQIARDYGVPPETIKTVGVAVYFASDDRKVTVMHKQFSGNVAGLLFTMIDQQEFGQAVQEAVMRLMAAMRTQAQSCAGECSSCGETCTEPTAAQTQAQEKRPEFDSLYG